MTVFSYYGGHLLCYFVSSISSISSVVSCSSVRSSCPVICMIKNTVFYLLPLCSITLILKWAVWYIGWTSVCCCFLLKVYATANVGMWADVCCHWQFTIRAEMYQLLWTLPLGIVWRQSCSLELMAFLLRLSSGVSRCGLEGALHLSSFHVCHVFLPLSFYSLLLHIVGVRDIHILCLKCLWFVTLLSVSVHYL